jgi:flagellar hook-associated protein 3 FlgL
MTRVANLAQQDRTIALIMDAQTRMRDAQMRVSSGAQSQDYQGIARDTSRLVNLENAHVKVTQYVETNNFVDQRLRKMETSVSGMIDIMSEYKSLLISALNSGNAQNLDMNNQAVQLRDQMAALLNTKEDGRFLFSGAMTDTAPVDTTQLPISYTVPTSDGDSAAYFQGNSQKFSVRADDSLTLSYGVTADETGFEQAIRALDLMVKAGPTDVTALNHALDVTNQALDGLPDIRTRIGLNRASLESVNQRHNDFLLFAEGTISDLENTDVAQAITELQSAQTSLEASFTTLARLSQLNLMSFLR